MPMLLYLWFSLYIFLCADVGVYEEDKGDWQKAAEAYEEAAALLLIETKEAQAYQVSQKKRVKR